MSLYGHLLALPLFQGLGSEEMTEIIGQTRFGFFKRCATDAIVRADTPCTSLIILLEGAMAATRAADDHAYTLTERLSPPTAIEPFRLHGLHQRYARTYVATTPCSFVILGKDEVAGLLRRYLVVRLNWLGMVSTRAHRLEARPWRTPPATLRQRIARFIGDRCDHPAGPKTLDIKMTRLAAEVGDSRLHVSQALHSLQRDGLVALSRQRIAVPALEALLQRA